MKAVFANSFDAERAEKIAVELYGDDAVTAVACCALDARCDGRKGDFRFWFEIFCRLKGTTSSKH